jgi:tRNA (pseudouridine54-N1)-methyltransferase
MQPESTMLRFIQLLPNASPRGDFLLRDLPGSGKRIDVLCRDLAACFSWGTKTWLKDDLELVAVIADSKMLVFSNPKEDAPEGEVAWATVIRDSLKDNPPNYVRVADGSTKNVILRYNNPPKSMLWVLDETGSHISTVLQEESVTQNSFMLGDHRGFDSQTENLMSRYSLPKISLGKKSYLSSHCVASIISEFERSENVR